MIPDARQNRRKPKPKPGVRQNLRGAVQNVGGMVGDDPRGSVQEGVGGPAVDPYDFSSDPILARIMAVGIQSRQHAQAEATRALADLDIEYGVGAGGEANPHSVLKKLAEREQKAPTQLDEGLDPSLIYSSTRATRQSDLARDLLEARTNAASTYRQRTEGVNSSLRGLLLGFDQDENAAREDAAGRRIAQLGDTDPLAGRKPPITRAAAAVRKAYKPPRAPRRPIKESPYG